MDMRPRFAAFAKCTRGTASMELGITAPFLIVALIMMFDTGIALGTRMELDRNVRAGVQATMSQINDLDAIRDMIIASTGGSETVSVIVDKVCSCGNSVTPCTNWCSVNEPPSVFVNITATQPYTGLILPASVLESETHVQLR